MSDAILDENETESEPITPDEFIRDGMQDLILGNPPEMLADEFINEFVLLDRPETEQLLMMLDAPTEQLLEALKGIAAQSYQVQIEALNTRGFQYLDSLKAEVKAKLTALATAS
jgi:hypothetical protein